MKTIVDKKNIHFKNQIKRYKLFQFISFIIYSNNKTMAERRRTVFQVPAPKPSTVSKPKRSSTLAKSSSSLVTKGNPVVSREKVNKNVTINSNLDTLSESQENLLPEHEADYNQVAYGKFLRAMLEDCMIQEKIVHEKDEIDDQMMYLAKRFQQTIDQLDKTNKTIKNISFLAEQQSLINSKNKDTIEYYEEMEKSGAEKILSDLTSRETESLDRLKIKGIDFGYSKESGHKQLLDAVNDAIEGLQAIKDNSKLDVTKLKQFERFQTNIEDVTKSRKELDDLKKEFERKFPKFGEQLMKETSERIAKMMEDDDDQNCDNNEDLCSSD